MARLDAADRKALPGSTFAGPHRSFPIPDASHARAALSMAHHASDPGAIQAAVHRKFPGIGQAVRKRVQQKLSRRGPSDAGVVDESRDGVNGE